MLYQASAGVYVFFVKNEKHLPIYLPCLLDGLQVGVLLETSIMLTFISSDDYVFSNGVFYNNLWYFLSVK